MTESGLRREAARGRLVIERIAGKDYTTLAAIARMRELCRVAVSPEGRTSTSGKGAQPKTNTPPGSSETPDMGVALDAAKLTVEELKKL